MSPSEASKPGDGMMSGWAGCFLTGKHGLYSDMFWTPLIAQALAVERKKDSEMAGHKVFRHFIQLIQLIRYFHRISVNNSMRFQRSERSLWPSSSTVVSASRCHSNGPKIQHSIAKPSTSRE